MHVLRIAAQLDYQPNFFARGLSTAHSQIFAAIVPDLTRSLVTEALRGAERAAGQAGYSLLLSFTSASHDPRSVVIERAMTTAEGVLLIDSEVTDGRAHRLAAQKATVLVGESVPDVSSVVSDSSPALRAAVRLLNDLGHRSITYLVGSEPRAIDARRWEMVQAACEELAMQPRRIDSSPGYVGCCIDMVPAVVASSTTSILCDSTDVAFGLIHRLRSSSVQVPSDVSIISFDDAGTANLADPPLTAITPRGARMGAAAVASLLSQLAADAPAPAQAQKVPADLILRASTAAAARG